MANEFSGIKAVFGAPAPDIFFDDATGFDIVNGVLRIDLGTVTRSGPIPPSDPQISVIGRLVMPIETAQRLCLGLYDYLKKTGHDPAEMASGGQTAQ